MSPTRKKAVTTNQNTRFKHCFPLVTPLYYTLVLPDKFLIPSLSLEFL